MHTLRLLRARARPRVVVRGRPRLGRRVRLEVAQGGELVLGDGCVLGDGTWVQIRGGKVTIGTGAVLGDCCRLVAHAGIDVGPRCVLADEVAIVDVDHDVGDIERPIREQPLLADPIVLGQGAVVEHGAALLRGVTIGPGARIGARAVVTRDVPAGTSVEGVPARPPSSTPLKKRPSKQSPSLCAPARSRSPLMDQAHAALLPFTRKRNYRAPAPTQAADAARREVDLSGGWPRNRSVARPPSPARGW